ncbi:MAG TPA: YdeI/OmpD-associated family protein [Chthoniobacteraceae bacterium]|nr:YdeI/OmpD-associated family protein [Chthoniobacteraceae bacterium]
MGEMQSNTEAFIVCQCHLWAFAGLVLYVWRRRLESFLTLSAGMQAVEAAKADGRWKAAYDSPRNALPLEDFLKELGKNKKAKAFFETLNKANVYAIVYRLQTAKKPETRERRMKLILAMMAEGKAFHPIRPLD